MRKLAILLSFIVLSNLTYAQGINFFNGTYEEALTKAKEQNKLIFIDFYADWCAPCKMMSNEVFPDKALGDYFNSKFISVKLDTEKKENKAIVKKYKVTAMPTLLFLNPIDAKAISLKAGALDIASLMKEAQIAAGDQLSFTALYDKYKVAPDDLKIIGQLLQEAPSFVGAQEGLEAEKWIIRIEKLYNNYIAKKMGPELINKVDFAIIRSFHKFGEPNDKLMEFINRNLQAFMEAVEGVSPGAYLIQHHNKVIEKYAREGNMEYQKQLERINGDLAAAYNVMPKKKLTPYEQTKSYYDAEYFIFYKKDATKYAELMNKYLDALGEDAQAADYGGAAQTMYNATAGKISDQMHAQAIAWVTKALSFEGIDLMNKINLLVMLGDSYKAIKEYGKTKECYNQAYMTSLQMEEGYTQMSMQMVIKRKLSALDLVK